MHGVANSVSSFSDRIAEILSTGAMAHSHFNKEALGSDYFVRRVSPGIPVEFKFFPTIRGKVEQLYEPLVFFLVLQHPEKIHDP